MIESIANYFNPSIKVRLGRSKDVQIHLRSISLWENIIFKHFEQYPLYGSKKLKLSKLLIIREIKRNNKHLIQIGKCREWKPDCKLLITKIWNN